MPYMKDAQPNIVVVKGCDPFKRKEGKGEFGMRLKNERIARGFGVEDFAKRCGINVTSLTAVENRGSLPRIPVLVRMAQVLDCTTDYLCGVET